MEGLHQSTLRQSFCRQGVQQARILWGPLQPRPPSRSRTQVKHKKNKLMPLWNKTMLRKRHIIECINELLKNKANLVYSRHRPYITSSWIFVRHWLHTVSSRISSRDLPVRIEKSRQLKLFQTNLIPNWRKYEGKQLKNFTYLSPPYLRTR